MQVVLTTLLPEAHGYYVKAWASRFVHLLFLSSLNLGLTLLGHVDHTARVRHASR